MDKPKARRRLFRVGTAAAVTSLGLAGIVAWLILSARLIIHPAADWKVASPIQLRVRPVYVAEPGYEQTGHKYLYDPTLGWRNIPGWRFSTMGRKLTINRNGLRGREHTFSKPAGTRRVLVLGDSYAWGYGVSDDEVFPAALERLLAAAPSKWEVINTGVSGWGTDQEYLFLLHEGWKYSPDVVVLSFFILNDGLNSGTSRQYGLDKPVFLDRDLKLANVPVPRPRSQAPVIKTHANPGELIMGLIGGIARLGQEKGFRLVVMKFGQFLEPASPEVAMQSRMLGAMAARFSNTHYLDLDQEFKARGLAEAQLVLQGARADGHWNAAGHAEVAKILKEFLAAHGLLVGSG